MLAGNLYDSFTQAAQAYKTAFESCAAAENSGGTSSGGGSSAGGKKTSSGNATAVPIARPASQSTAPFGDLEGFEWAKESIENLYKKGIISGKENGRYMPAENVSRAEFIKMLVTALGIEGSKPAPFTDTEKGAWYAGYIDRAYSAGIIFGNPDGAFCPNDSISRQDMAVIIYRAAEKYFSDSDTAAFADSADIAPYAEKAVGALYFEKILTGMPNGAFMPENCADRAQTAVIIERLMKYIDRV